MLEVDNGKNYAMPCAASSGFKSLTRGFNYISGSLKTASLFLKMITRKTRRHSGRVTPRSGYGMKYSKMISRALEPKIHWDDWNDYRDGMRINRDKKQIRNPRVNLGTEKQEIKKNNKKLKKHYKIRKARKSLQ